MVELGTRYRLLKEKIHCLPLEESMYFWNISTKQDTLRTRKCFFNEQEYYKYASLLLLLLQA